MLYETLYIRFFFFFFFNDTATTEIYTLSLHDALPISSDGTMTGPDLETLARVRKMTRLELQYSGGVSSLDDIRRANAAGAKAVILGKALYEGRLKLEEALAL